MLEGAGLRVASVWGDFDESPPGPDSPRLIVLARKTGETVVIPYAKYPGLSPLFLEFLEGAPDLYPDPPTLEAAAARGTQLLAAGRRARVPASAFRCRGAEARRMAEELAAGRAVAVSAGHQVGLFTGPLFTLMKALRRDPPRARALAAAASRRSRSSGR